MEKQITINIEKLIENFSISNPETLPVNEIRETVKKALLQAVNDAKSVLENETVQGESPLTTKITYTAEEILHHYEEDKDKIVKRINKMERIIRDQEGRILYSDCIDGGYFHKRAELTSVFDAWNMAHK